MISAAFDINQFIRDTAAVARLVPASDLFPRSLRRIQLPPSCIALACTENHQPQLIKGGGWIDAETASEVMFVKTGPAFINYRISRLNSKDDFEFQAEVRIAVQVVPERTELALFRREVLGHSGRADISDLTRHCEETVRETLTAFAAQREAETLSSPGSWTDFDAFLAERFNPLGFSSGLSLAADVRLTLDSPDFQEAKLAAVNQADRAKRAESEAARRALALETRRSEMEDLIKLIERARAADDPAHFLKTIQLMDAARRAETYGGLMGLSAQTSQTAAIVTVAGQELLWFDPSSPTVPSRRLELPASLGALRSVRLTADGERALVGARTGVHIVNLDDGMTQSYLFPMSREPRGGVNAAALIEDKLYATHSEIGLVRWTISNADAAESCLADLTKGAKTVRDAQSQDGRLWFAAGPRVIAWNPKDPPSAVTYLAPNDVQTLLVADGGVFAGLDNGAILRWPIGHPVDAEPLRPADGRAVHSLEWLGGGGAPRLLIADQQPYLTLQVLGDSYQAQYRWRRGLRWGFAAEDLIVGVDESRDQLILWRSDDPHEPFATISIGRLTGQPIQDVGIIPCA